MVSKLTVSIQRWVALLAFLVYDLAQIFIIGHLKVKPDSHLIIRYSFQWTTNFQLEWFWIAVLIVIPFVISYLFAINSVRDPTMVQILGPQSLMHRMKMEFHRGNPEGQEFTPENVQYLLEDMAVGEPDGTLENLEMLFSIGVLIEQLIEEAGVASVKRVYMSDDLAPNAFTLRVIPIPYIGSDWIIINRNVVDVLNRNEIRAVVAHEIGHAARKDSWINSALYSPRFIIIVGWSIIFAAMANIILVDPFSTDSFLRLIALFAFFIMVRLLMNGAHYITAYAYRKTELLADHYAADLIGSEILINALIKIGKRGQVIRSINQELEWLDKKFEDIPIQHLSMRILHFFDPGETSQKKAREFAIAYYIRAKMNQLFVGLRIEISDEQFNSYVKEATQNVLRERGIELSEDDLNLLEPDKMQQRLQDQRRVNLESTKELDFAEIERLVQQMKSEGENIFESEAIQQVGVLPGAQTHPHVTQRVTFLYDTLLKNKKH